MLPEAEGTIAGALIVARPIDPVIERLPANRLLPCLSASALLHLLMLGIELPRAVEPTSSSGVTLQAPYLKIRLLEPQKAAFLNRSREVSRHSATPHVRAETGPVVAASMSDNEPSLISPMPGYIEFPITSGFMILSLNIDPGGAVEASEVIYSELSRYATRIIELRFAQASYRPAIRQGQPVKGKLLLKIDIAP